MPPPSAVTPPGPAAATPPSPPPAPPATPARTPVVAPATPPAPPPPPADPAASASASTSGSVSTGALPASGDSLSAFSSDSHVDDILSHFAVGVEMTSNSIGLTPRAEYSSKYDPVDPHKEWDRYISLAVKGRFGSWGGFSLDPRFSIGVTKQDGQSVPVQEAFGEDAIPPEEVPMIPDQGGPEVPLPPTQNPETGEWQPGGTRPVTSEDINHANLEAFDIDSSGYQWKVGVDATWMAWDWIGIFAGPTYYRMWGDYDTSGDHNVGAPRADIWTYSELQSYEESGWGVRAGLTIRPLASAWNGRGLGIELNPFYEYTSGTREVSYLPSGIQVIGDRQPDKTDYDVTRHTLGLQAMFYRTPAKVAIPEVETAAPAPAPVVPTLAACSDRSTLEATKKDWAKKLFKDPDKPENGLIKEVEDALKDMGKDNAAETAEIIKSLRVEIQPVAVYNGPDGIAPKTDDAKVEVVLTATVGGKKFVLLDDSDIPNPVRPLTQPTLAKWIKQHEAKIEVRPATDAIQAKWNPEAFKFNHGHPQKNAAVDTLAKIKADTSAMNVADFERYLKDFAYQVKVGGATRTRRGILSDFVAAKKVIDETIAAIKAGANADERIRQLSILFVGAASQDGDPTFNKDLSARRAELIRIWFDKAIVAANTGVAADRQLKITLADYGVGEDEHFRKSSGLSDKQAAGSDGDKDRRVDMLFVAKPVAPSPAPADLHNWMTGEILKLRDSNSITYVAEAGKPAQTVKPTSIKLGDYISLEPFDDGKFAGKKEAAPLPAPAGSVALVMSVDHYLIDGKTLTMYDTDNNPATPGVTVTGVKVRKVMDCDMAPEVTNPAPVAAPAPAGAPSPATPAAAAGPAAAGAPPAAVTVIPTAADPAVKAFEDYDEADEAVKEDEEVVGNVEASLNPLLEGGPDAHQSLAGIRAAGDETERNKRADKALVTARVDVAVLNKIIPNMQKTRSGIMNANDDQFDNNNWFGSNHGENQTKLKGRIEAALTAAEPKVKELLAKLAAFIAAVEAEKARPFVAPPAAPAAPAAGSPPPAGPAPVAGPAGPAAPVVAPAPAAAIVKVWRSETIKAYGGGGTIAKNIGQAEIEIESDLTADQLKARIRVQIEGSPTRVAPTGVTAVVGKTKTFKVSFSFTADKNQAKNVEMFDMQPGTPDTAIYTGHIAVNNAATAVATFKAGAKPSAPVAGAAGGGAGATPLTWTAAATVNPTNPADKSSGKVTASFGGTAPATGFEILGPTSAAVAGVTLAAGSLSFPYSGLTVGGTQIFKIREQGKTVILQEVALKWIAPDTLKATAGDPIR